MKSIIRKLLGCYLFFLKSYYCITYGKNMQGFYDWENLYSKSIYESVFWLFCN